MMLPDPLSIVIADDHPVVLKGLREVIEEDDSLRIVGEAGNGRFALELIERLVPRVAVLDVGMPEMTGLEIARCINDASLPVAVIILTVYDDEGIFNKAMESGVMGYILKDSTAVDIVRAIKQVAKGEYYISPTLTGALLQTTHALDPITEKRLGLNLLTQAERRVLKLIGTSMSTKQIADELGISPRTVNHHRTNISAKLHLSGSFSLLRFAMENKGVL